MKRHAFSQLLLWSGLYYLFPALLPTIVSSTSWKALSIYAALTGGFLVWALFSPIAGIIVDRGYGAASMRLAGLAGAGILTLIAAAPSEPVTAALLVVIGVPLAMLLYDPCFAVILRRLGPGTEADGAVTAVTLIAGFATMATFLPVAGLLASGLGWRRVIVIFAAVVVIGALLVPADAMSANTHSSSRPRLVLPGQKLIIFGLAFACIIFAHAVLLFQIPTLLSRSMSSREALMLPMLLGPSQVGGRLVWKFVRSRVAPSIAVIALFGGLLFPPLLLLWTHETPGIAIGAVILQGAGFGVQTTIRPALALTWLPSDAIGLQFGWIAMIGLIFMALGPVAGSAAQQVGGSDGVLALVLISVAVAFAMICGLAFAMRSQGMAP